MKRFLFAAVFTLLAALASQEAGAQTRYQQQRINQGVRNGQLTRREAHSLRSREAAYHQAQRVSRADGYVSPRERAYLNHIRRNNSRAIYHQKHDWQRRW